MSNRESHTGKASLGVGELELQVATEGRAGSGSGGGGAEHCGGLGGQKTC